MSFVRVLFSALLVFLFVGCDNPQKKTHIGPTLLRIDQVACQRYDVNDAVPVLEYAGSGIVRYLTRGGEYGEIDLAQQRIRDTSSDRFRQYGMPYQLIADSNFVSSSDKGIRVGNESLTIRGKGSHYSAYKSLYVDDQGSVLACTSDGIFLFQRDCNQSTYRDSVDRLYPQDKTKTDIREVRFLDLVKWDDDIYYAAGHAGVVRVNLRDRQVDSVGVDALTDVSISHLRVSEERNDTILYAYAENGQLYTKGKTTNTRWTHQDCVPGVLQWFKDSQNREWYIGFDKATEVWKDTVCVAKLSDEPASGMVALNNRIQACAVMAGEYGYVLARGRYIYLIPRNPVLTPSDPILSACIDDKEQYLYCKVGIRGDYSGLFRVDISSDKEIGPPEYLRDIPRYARLIGVKEGRAFLQKGDSIQLLSLNRNKNEGIHHERLVLARMDKDGELLCLKQNELIAYDDAIDNMVAGIEKPEDYYPQTFISILGGKNPEVGISTIHNGVRILKRNDSREWDTLTVKNNHYFIQGGHYDPVIIMAESFEKPSDEVYLYTQKGWLFRMYRSTDEEGWLIEPKSDENVRLDEIAAGQDGLYGLNYFSMGVRNLLEKNTPLKENHLHINSLCTVPGKGVVYCTQEGLYCSWGNQKATSPIPIRFALFEKELGIVTKYKNIFIALLLILVTVFLTSLFYKKRRKKTDSHITTPEEFLNVIRDDSNEPSSDILDRETSTPDSNFVERNEGVSFSESSLIIDQHSEQDFEIAWKELKSSLNNDLYSRYIERMKKVILRKVRDHWDCGYNTCQILKEEASLIEKYFSFLSTIEQSYRKKPIIDKNGLYEIQSVYGAFKDGIESMSSARDEFSIIGFTDFEEKRVRSYFLFPLRFDDSRASSNPSWDTSFKDFVSVSYHKTLLSQFRNNKGTFSPGWNKLLNSRLGNGKGFGLIALIGCWTHEEDLINPGEVPPN